jgi:hypothetical protein
MYRITQYTKDQAKKLGVQVKPSKNAHKKLDVFDKNGNFLASIGSSINMDYPSYKILEEQGKYQKGYANKRRELFRKRNESWKHQSKTSPGYLAYYLLW